MKTPIDTGFIHEISQLDKIRQKATDSESSEDALKAVASQFEALFTQMMFKSMRDANAAFESDLIDDRTSKFYQQLSDEQLSSSLSKEGALGLTNLIVEQFKGLTQAQPMQSDKDIDKNKQEKKQTTPEINQVAKNEKNEEVASAPKSLQVPEPVKEKPFLSPSDFVAGLFPLASKAAKLLGADPKMILAQAALETGWGKHVINNKEGNSHNLFNIKASPDWQGDKVVKQTLEFHDAIPVQEKAAFRSYASYQESFDDFVNLMKNNARYAKALNLASEPEKFIQGLQKAGYATDPQYADKIINVYNKIKNIILE